MKITVLPKDVLDYGARDLLLICPLTLSVFLEVVKTQKLEAYHFIANPAKLTDRGFFEWEFLDIHRQGVKFIIHANYAADGEEIQDELIDTSSLFCDSLYAGKTTIEHIELEVLRSLKDIKFFINRWKISK